MNCPHHQHRVELTPAGPHHGKRICCTCGAFRGWEPKPGRDEIRERVTGKLDALQAMRLPLWENNFIQSLLDHSPKSSPKQLAKLDELCKRHGLN